jgi:hypothetical protein
VRHHLRAREGSEAAVRRRDDPRLVPDGVDGLTDPVGDDLGMLHVVRRRVDHAGQEQHPVGQGMPREDFVLVLMTGVGERNRERAHLRAVEERQHGREIHVMRVRAVVVPPADVEPDAVGRDVRDRLVDRLDVQRHHLLESLERIVLEEADALHREVRTIHLQHEPARVDQLVLLLDLAGERHHVALVGVVVRVEQDRRHHAG